MTTCVESFSAGMLTWRVSHARKQPKAWGTEERKHRYRKDNVTFTVCIVLYTLSPTYLESLGVAHINLESLGRGAHLTSLPRQKTATRP